MKRSVKILSGLLAVLALAACVAALLFVIGWPVGELRMHELLTNARRLPAVLLTVIAALGFGALGVFTLYGLFTEHFTRRTSAVIEKNALGEAGIAFDALALLVDTVVRANESVKSSKTKVSAVGDLVRIDVRVVTKPTVSLVELTHTLQDAIDAHIRTVCGVAVGRIDVTVDQTDEENKPARIN